VTHLTDTLKYDRYIERAERKRTKRPKRRKGEVRRTTWSSEEAKDVGKNSKNRQPNNSRFSQRKDATAILIELSRKNLNYVLMIPMIQARPKEVRCRDKEYDHCDCARDRRAVSDEESKEADP
jgi:hypothetical protein